MSICSQAVAILANTSTAGTYGGGLNQWEVQKEYAPIFFQASSIHITTWLISNIMVLQSGHTATIFYAPMALTVKLALLFIVIRVFGDVHKKTMMGIYIFIGILVAYYVSCLFIKILICMPISAYWKGEIDKCINQSAIITADAIISVSSDSVILLPPTPLTWSLQLSRRKRLWVIGILYAGGVATAFSTYRLAMILHEGKSVNQTIVFTKLILSG